MDNSNRIKYALYLKGWNSVTSDTITLEGKAEPVKPTDYTEEMKGNIFCHACYESLTRSPLRDNSDASGRRAFFKHIQNPTYKCELKAKRKAGKTHSSESTSNEAVTSRGLVIVRTFKREEQQITSNQPSQYLVAGQGALNDRGLTDDALHPQKPDEPFSDPSFANTVLSICRDFDKNLMRPYLLPDSDQEDLLSNLLVNIRTVKDVDSTPRLYFGRVLRVNGPTTASKNITSTWIDFQPFTDRQDFCLKTNRATTEALKIKNDLAGRIVLIYGKVTLSGYGFCITDIHRDEFAILPSMYDSLLW